MRRSVKVSFKTDSIAFGDRGSSASEVAEKLLDSAFSKLSTA